MRGREGERKGGREREKEEEEEEVRKEGRGGGHTKRQIRTDTWEKKKEGEELVFMLPNSKRKLKIYVHS